MTTRTALLMAGSMGLLAWAGLVIFTRDVAPQNIMAFVAFFLLLIVAITCTLTPLAYGMAARVLARYQYRASVRQALRQSILLSLAVTLNLLLRALHSWNLFMGITIFGAAVVVEILSLAKK